MNKFFIQFRRYWWVVISGVVILGLLGGLIWMLTSGEPTTEMSTEEVIPEVEASVREGVDFRNADFVEKFIGETGSKEAVEKIEEAVYRQLDEGSYTAFAAGSDVTKGVSFPFSTLEFVLQVSRNSDEGDNTDVNSIMAEEQATAPNEGNFEVRIALLKDMYYGVLVNPVDGASDVDEMIVVYIRPPEEAGYTAEEATEKLKIWANS